MNDDVITMRSEQLAGSVAKKILAELKGMRLGWKETPQGEQEAFIDHCESLAVDLVQDVLEIITGDGVSEFAVTIHKTATNQDTVEAKISVSREAENALDLHKLAYCPAKLLASGNRDKYLDTGKRPKSDPDQPTMFEEEDDDDDEQEGMSEPAVQELERPQGGKIALVQGGGDGAPAKAGAAKRRKAGAAAGKSSPSKRSRSKAPRPQPARQLAELS